MRKSIKQMCKWDKDQIKDHFSDFSQAVGDASFACTKCGRAAATKDQLCKPKKLEK